jgi:hypothetical protein
MDRLSKRVLRYPRSRRFLDSNALTGTMPTELGKLTRISRLRLRTNGLEGTIPAQVGNMRDLAELCVPAHRQRSAHR